MENKKFKTKLSYRGSRDGWMAADFHRMSDGKGPSVSFFKIKENDQCIGGFSSFEWQSKIEFYTDSNAFLFNLSKKKLFKC